MRIIKVQILVKLGEVIVVGKDVIILLEEGHEFGVGVGAGDFGEKHGLLFEDFVESSDEIETRFGVFEHKIGVMVVVVEGTDGHGVKEPSGCETVDVDAGEERGGGHVGVEGYFFGGGVGVDEEAFFDGIADHIFAGGGCILEEVVGAFLGL